MQDYTLYSVTWDKYMGSKIDSVTLFFYPSTSYHEVGEYNVPEDEKHMIFYAERKDRSWDWVMIVNPQAISENPQATIPDITVLIERKKYSLRDALIYVMKKADVLEEEANENDVYNSLF